MRRCAAAVVVATVALTLLPSVPAAPDPSAPAATAAFPMTPDRIVPLGEPASARMTVTYDCSRQHPTEPTTIALDVVARPPWLTATPNVTTVVDRVDRARCAEQDHRRTVRVAWRLAADGDAPARRPRNLTVRATVELADGNHTAEASVTVEAAFYSVVSREGPTRRQAPAGESVDLPLTVRNEGNGPVRIDLATREVDDGLEIRLPEPGIAPAPWQDGEPATNATIGLTGADPGRVYEATLAVVPRYAEEPDVAGETLTYRVLLTTDALPVEASPSDLIPHLVAVPAYISGLALTVGLGSMALRRAG